jgi:DNA polymerase (family 10)
MDKFAIAAALREMGRLLEAQGEIAFKVRAYDRGAHTLEAYNGDLGALVARGGLESLPNIGPALATKIAELYTTGRSEKLEKLRSELPSGIHDLLRVPDLGPKRIGDLFRALGIQTLADLRAAAEAGKIRDVRGFSLKSEAAILAGIDNLDTTPERRLLLDALAEGEPLLAHLRRHPAVERAELAGSARRWRETVADLDIVVATSAPAEVAAHFVAWPPVASVAVRGDTLVTVHLGNGLQIDLRMLPAEDFATALHHFTGSKAHHIRLRGLARDRGLTISEWGVTRIEGGEKLPIRSEADLYAALGMSYVPPELREDEGEVEEALAGVSFADLVTAEDIRGMVHCHSTWSDGKSTIAEMARAADALGMAYLTITDHSPHAHYAGGVELDRLKRQWDEIDEVQAGVSVRLLKGTESDILQDGSLDYPDAILERMDVVIASVHERHRMDEAAMTERLVTAMRHPVFKIWGHALGRLIQNRPPFACRVEEVLDAIAESRAAIEVNGDPHRLDLEPRWIREARKRGIRFTLSVDAHSTAQLGYLRYAVGTARRGGVRRGEVLNTLPAAEFAAAVRPA